MPVMRMRELLISTIALTGRRIQKRRCFLRRLWKHQSQARRQRALSHKGKLLWRLHGDAFIKTVSGGHTRIAKTQPFLQKTNPEKSRPIYAVFRLKSESNQPQVVEISTS